MTDRTESGSLPNQATEISEDPLFERVEGWLDAGDWNYTANRERGWFSMGVSTTCGSVRTMVEANDRGESEFIAVHCILPVFVPSQRRAAVAELLSRFNCTHSLGTLQIDMEDGEVRARAAIDLSGTPVAEETFTRILSVALRTADRAYAAILAVAFGDVDPAHAFTRVRSAEEREAEGVTLQ